MKKYALYIIVFLIVVSGFFIYNSNKLVKEVNRLKQENKEINEGYDNNIQYAIRLEDSISDLHQVINKLRTADKFSLAGNPKAHNYLKEIDADIDWEKYITGQLMATNIPGKNNKLVPFDGMAGKMQIDNVKILDNRWIMAHFTDGTYTGEMILRYDIDKNNHIKFKVLDQTLFGN